jgi:hypothetical protein
MGARFAPRNFWLSCNLFASRFDNSWVWKTKPLRYRLAAHALLERQPFEIFHRKEGLLALAADFLDRADVRMVQTGSSTSFAPKSL